MSRPAPFQVLLSESAERPFLALPFTVREQLRRMFDHIAALAAVAPPIDPVWRKVPHHGTPLLRFTLERTEIVYEVDLEARTLRIVAVRPAEHGHRIAG